MKYSFKKINIEAPFPTTACGHSCQTVLMSEFKDHLFARVVGFKDETNWIIHISFDLLAFDLKHRDMLQEELRKFYQDENLHLITSATHTHYANSVRDPKYIDYLYDLLVKEIEVMEYRETGNITTSYQREYTRAVGKSRISGYETNNENLCLMRFYEDGTNFLNIVYNNCHPTTLDANTPFFSAEYPGYVLKKLEEKYKNCDFTFVQGASGDISSRFVRNGQSYADMEELALRLYSQIEDMMSKFVNKNTLALDYKEIEIPYEHEFTPIDLSNLRNDLTERELETIRIGSIEREKLKEQSNLIFDRLASKAVVSVFNIGSVKLVFYPNEIFSAYMDYLDLDKSILISYSNGYGPYILPIDFPFITYEMFTDTLTRNTKERIIDTLRNI